MSIRNILFFLALFSPGTAFLSEKAPLISDKEYDSIMDGVDLDADFDENVLNDAEIEREELRDIKEANRLLFSVYKKEFKSLRLDKLFCPIIHMPNRNDIRKKIEDEFRMIPPAGEEIVTHEMIHNETDQRYKTQLELHEQNLKRHKDTYNECNNFNIGFYKGDIKRLVFMAGAIGLDYWFYKTLKRKKLDFVLEQIKKDPEIFLQLIEEIHDSPEALKEFTAKPGNLFNRVKKFFDIRRFLKRKHPKISALYTYIKNNHNLIGYNPFKRELLSTNLLMLLSQEIALQAYRMQNESDISIKGSLTSRHEGQKLLASMFSFEKDEHGAYKPIGPGISMITIIGWLFNTGSTMSMARTNGGETQFSWLKGIELTGNVVGYEQPKVINKFLHSSWSPFICRILTHFVATKFFDSACTAVWIEYIHKNSKRLRSLLKCYADAKKTNTMTKIRELNKKLEAYVKRGHENTSVFPLKNFYTWFSSRATVLNWKSAIFYGIVAGPVTYKICDFIYKMFIRRHGRR